MHANVRKIQSRRASGFSLMEIMIALVLIISVAAVVVDKFATTNVSVGNTKLTSDVRKLNEVVAVYLASGGSLDGITTAQGVLDKLKMVMPTNETNRQVGIMTGRGIDVRQVATTQSSKQATSTNLRAFWNSATKQFTLATTGTGGVASFDLDDTLAGKPVTVDTGRVQSNELYNGSAGWIWASGNNNSLASLTPNAPTLQNTSVSSQLDPTLAPSSSSSSSSSGSSSTSSSSTSSTTSSSSSSSSSTSTSSTGSVSGSLPTGSTPGTLPTPIITTKGGRFSDTTFPSQVFIDPNAAPAAVSTLEYQLTGPTGTVGAWTPYTGPLTVPSGYTVTAKNFSSNTALYNNSATDTQSYYIIQAWFGGTLVCKWNSSTGPSGFTSSRNNTNPLNVIETDGKAYSGSTNGANTFTFTSPGSFTNIAPNTSFTIGNLVYHNGTINSGTGSTGLNLELDITMSTPQIATTPCHIAIALSNTANSGDGNNSQSADAATLSNPVTDYSVMVNGVQYTLVVSYGSIDSTQGYVSGNTVNVWEGATGLVSVIAQFASNH